MKTLPLNVLNNDIAGYFAWAFGFTFTIHIIIEILHDVFLSSFVSLISSVGRGGNIKMAVRIGFGIQRGCVRCRFNGNLFCSGLRLASELSTHS
jgi:hypothetical protein